MEESGSYRGTRPSTIGVLVNWFGDLYSTPIIGGVVDVAREQGINVMCFAGARPRSMLRYDPPANVTFDLVGPESVDGLVLISGTLVQLLGEGGLVRFADRLASLPLVSVALEIPERASVVVDNEKGLHDLIVHLIKDHGCTRIGFVRGPESSPEAESRLRVYRTVMAEHDLPVDPDWIAPGMFDDASGKRAVEILFGERQVSLEALVVANDQMALGAIDALAERGIDVPRSLSLVGFDDTDVSNFATPALTTVRQPLYKLGRKAATALVAQMAGGPRQQTLVLPAEPVIRESCGCSLREARHPSGRLALGKAPPWQASLAQNRQELVTEIAGAFDYPALGSTAWGGPLVDSFAGELDGLGEGGFVKAMEQMLRGMTQAGEDVWSLQKLLTILRHWFRPWLAGNPPLATRAEELLGQAGIIIGDTARRVQADRRLLFERRARTLSSISQALISTLDMRELAAILGEGLPQLDINSCFLCLYQDPTAPLEWSHLALWVDDHGQGRLADSAARFRSRRLIPEGMLLRARGMVLVLEPLYFKQEQLGFVLLELGPREGAFYDELRQQLSSALMRLSREEELARLHYAEKERSRELEQAYRRLQENQEKLLISEKMAALGRLTAGMAHEMNTPLAAVRMALEEIAKLAEEYRASLDDPRITADDHREIAKEMSGAARLAAGAAEQVAGFVQGIKFQTRDMSSQEHSRFNAVPIIQDTLLLLNHLLRKSGCTISFEHPAGPVEICGYPGRLSQVVTNLVTNAIDASRAKGGGPIVLWLSPEGAQVELRVSDKGGGIAPEIMKRIFDPMFTTKPFGEGTGLGLSIVHDIVSSDFGGTIEVDSRVGEGATFTLRLASTEE